MVFLFLSFILKQKASMILKFIKFSYYNFLFSILIIFLINPGIPSRKFFSKNYKIKENQMYYCCNKCNIVAPVELNTAHCELCNICILNYDHHCIWTGKCIGKGNIIFFVDFLISLLLFIFSAIFIVFIILYKQLKI